MVCHLYKLYENVSMVSVPISQHNNKMSGNTITKSEHSAATKLFLIWELISFNPLDVIQTTTTVQTLSIIYASLLSSKPKGELTIHYNGMKFIIFQLKIKLGESWTHVTETQWLQVQFCRFETGMIYHYITEILYTTKNQPYKDQK